MSTSREVTKPQRASMDTALRRAARELRERFQVTIPGTARQVVSIQLRAVRAAIRERSKR